MSIARLIAADLRIPVEDIRRIARSSDAYYKHFMLGRRKIDAPTVELKLLQVWIADFLKTECESMPEYVTAYENGSNIVRNALIHASKEHVLSIDIKHFFHSCSRKLVEGLFRGVSISHRADICLCELDVSDIELLSNLACYRGSLPMGAPSSPFIANRIFLPIDRRIRSSLPEGYMYSRYSDDICISSNDWIDEQKIVKSISGMLSKYGFEVNMNKVHCAGKGSLKRVTGIVITPEGGLSIGKKRKSSIKSKLHYLLSTASDGSHSIDPRVVMGELNFCKQVDSDYFNRLLAKYSGYPSAVEHGGVLSAIKCMMG